MIPGSQKRRAPRTSAFVEFVSIGFLIGRDGGIRQLCRGPVTPAAPAPDPSSPTSDHAVPPSEGGTHSGANARLAHCGCNGAKGNRRDWTPA